MKRNRSLSVVLTLLATISFGTFAASASAFELNGNPPWPGAPGLPGVVGVPGDIGLPGAIGLIEYSATVKGGDKWAVAKAAEAWNDSGALLLFKRVARKDADLLIRYDKRSSCNSGFTSVNFPPFRAEIVMGQCKGVDKFQQVQLVAHEMGHVIGLEHENGVCSVMNERTTFFGSPASTHPFKCPAPPKKSWRCGLLSTDDISGATKLYGGVVGDLGPSSCKLTG